jgi:hypothetical protein
MHNEMETAEKYRQRAEAVDSAAEAATDNEAKRILRSAAQRWRQLAEIVERVETVNPP